MAGLPSVYLINVNQACPGHQLPFPGCLSGGAVGGECWCQKTGGEDPQERGETAPGQMPGSGSLGVLAWTCSPVGGQQVSSLCRFAWVDI